MVENSDSPQFEGVKETVNGEIDVFEVFPDGGTTQITDLDRIEERVAGGFQIAEHKATQKESLFGFKELDEVINTFFERDSDSGNLRLKRGATRQNVRFFSTCYAKLISDGRGNRELLTGNREEILTKIL